MKYELYQVKSGAQINQWRWRLKAANGQIIASGESYINKTDCQVAVGMVMDTNRQTPFSEVAA